MPTVSQLITFLLLLLSGLPFALCSFGRELSNEELCQYLETPNLFVPGFRAQDLLNRMGTPRPMRVLMMDITDSFPDEGSPKEFAGLIAPYLKENLATLDDVKVASLVFQLDCIMDFLLFRKRK